MTPDYEDTDSKLAAAILSGKPFVNIRYPKGGGPAELRIFDWSTLTEREPATDQEREAIAAIFAAAERPRGAHT